MPTEDEVVERFRSINCWTRGDERAPHKPLLLLMALAQLQRGEGRWLRFTEIENPLRALLEEFGPPRTVIHPEYPFWRLRGDEIWEVPEAERIQSELTAAGDAPITVLRGTDARGGFTPSIYAFLSERSALVNRIAADLLDAAFPPTFHEALLDAVAFPWVVVPHRRDPRFRDHILRIYERQCAICGYDGRLGRNDLGIEAAHIKWHAAGGPDEPTNGLALCSFHHVAFDRGAFSADNSLRLLISQHVLGNTEVEHLLLRFAGRELRRPQIAADEPAPEFLEWHRDQVFRGPPREVDQSSEMS